MNRDKSSAIPGFHQRRVSERRAFLSDWAGLSADERDALIDAGLNDSEAALMIENVASRYALPLGIATNFRINGSDVLIPLVIEEPSVVAACSKAAKLFRVGGGFLASADDSHMIGQVQLLDLPDLAESDAAIESSRQRILDAANEAAGSLLSRGGGAIDLEARAFPGSSLGDMLVVHIIIDTRDAMGANAVNTVAEHVAPLLESLTGGRAHLRILSNLSDRRLSRACGKIPAADLASKSQSGEQVVAAIIEAALFAEIDPYRAATHNKGIMNGIDGLMIATGNDWRAVEAGAHAYAAKDGRYTSLTKWWKDDDGSLCGRIELPMALGIVGGATRVQRLSRTSLRILSVESARQLAGVAACVGLAQNLAAMLALATEGIQRGHMRMHARQLAMAAGAHENQAQQIADAMIAEGKIRLQRAMELVSERGQP